VQVYFAWEILLQDVEHFPRNSGKSLIFNSQLIALVQSEVAGVKVERGERKANLVTDVPIHREECNKSIWLDPI
jgi:hypothetical protein